MKWKRGDYVISTKIFWGGSGPNDKGLSRKHIVEGTKVLSRSSLMPQLHAYFRALTIQCQSALWSHSNVASKRTPSPALDA